MCNSLDLTSAQEAICSRFGLHLIFLELLRSGRDLADGRSLGTCFSRECCGPSCHEVSSHGLSCTPCQDFFLSIDHQKTKPIKHGSKLQNYEPKYTCTLSYLLFLSIFFSEHYKNGQYRIRNVTVQPRDARVCLDFWRFPVL